MTARWAKRAVNAGLRGRACRRANVQHRTARAARHSSPAPFRHRAGRDVSRICAKRARRRLVEIGFDGYAIGGVSVGEPEPEMMRAVEWSEPFLPNDKPRYAMGLGTPPQLLEMIARGIDMFDCVLPTRLARNGTAFTAAARSTSRTPSSPATRGRSKKAASARPARNFRAVTSDTYQGGRNSRAAPDHAAQPAFLSQSDEQARAGDRKGNVRRISERICSNYKTPRDGENLTRDMF